MVGKKDISNLGIDLNNFDDLKKTLPKLLIYFNFSNQDLEAFENQIDEYFNNAEQKIHNAGGYKDLVVDFANSFSFKSILISIISQLAGYRFGGDEEGNISIQKMPENQRTKGLYAAVFAGLLKWIMHQAEYYKETGQYEEEIKDILKFKD